MGKWTPGRRGAGLALGVYAAALAVVLLIPFGRVPSSSSSWLADLAARAGAPEWAVVQSRFEFACNALIVMPVSALGSVLWPRTTWRTWTAFAFATATAVEILQRVLLSERTPSFVDVVANTLGGLGGALAVALLRALARGRSAT